MIKPEIKKEYIITECCHCGNRTRMDIVARKIYSYREDFCCDAEYIILECCSCENISFGKLYSGEDTVEYDYLSQEEYKDTVFTMEYPTSNYKAENVPKMVNNAFKVAIKAQHLDTNLCLIALRRTLEILCKDQGETKGNLAQKLKRMSQKGALPKTLSDASIILKTLGNSAAHGDDKEYSNSVVKEILNLTQIIIEYVYIAPYKIKLIESELDL